MMITVPIKCPMCKRMGDSLQFWRMIDDYHLHICQECMEKAKGENDFLRIAFHHGQINCYNRIKEYIKKAMEESS